MGYVPRERRELNNFFKNYFGIFQVGGSLTLLGGRTTWGRSHGSRMWMSEGVLGSSKKASGRLGKACQGI
jgi:hypothetical protein